MDGMPSRETIRLWQRDDEAFALAVTHAREEGFHSLAEKAVEDAETETDPAKGRLKFDARRWYLGKLSNAFSDKQKHEHSGPDGKPIETMGKLKVEGLSDEQLRALASIPVQPD
jgi:hypothetical protein